MTGPAGLRLRTLGPCLVLAAACAAAGPEPERAAASVAARLLLLDPRHASGRTRLEAARALWRAGQRSSAARRYLGILLDSAAPEEASEAADRVAADPGLPAEGERLPELLARDLSALPAPVRARLLRRVALELLRQGRSAEGAGVLARLPTDGAAHYLRAVIELRDGHRDAARAELLLAERLGGADDGALASLGLARLDAADGELAAAARRYAALLPVSPAFFRARQELAWVELERGSPGAALAQTAVLAAPAWRRFFRPDRELVEAAALLGLCRDRAARIRAQRGSRSLRSHLDQIAVFLRERPDVRLYYVEAVASAAGRGPLPAELVAALLADASFYRAYQLVRQLQRERRLLLGGGGGALRAVLADEVDARLVVAQRRAGELTRRLLVGLQGELGALRVRLEELRFDLDGRALQELRAGRAGRSAAAGAGEASGGAPGAQAARGRESTIAVGRQQRWPLQGEYWLDEQRDFVVVLRSSCGSGSARPRRPGRGRRSGPQRRSVRARRTPSCSA